MAGVFRTDFAPLNPDAGDLEWRARAPPADAPAGPFPSHRPRARVPVNGKTCGAAPSLAPHSGCSLCWHRGLGRGPVPRQPPTPNPKSEATRDPRLTPKRQAVSHGCPGRGSPAGTARNGWVSGEAPEGAAGQENRGAPVPATPPPRPQPGPLPCCSGRKPGSGPLCGGRLSAPRPAGGGAQHSPCPPAQNGPAGDPGWARAPGRQGSPGPALPCSPLPFAAPHTGRARLARVCCLRGVAAPSGDTAWEESPKPEARPQRGSPPLC